MTTSVQQVLDTFDALSDTEKHQAALEILRRLDSGKAGGIPDTALVGLANELFLALDEQEAGHAPS